ncbi:MAG: ATP-binding protein [Rhodoferax sp.]|nr:MAG: ATP-binding protein [Rhodoferax sp.]
MYYPYFRGKQFELIAIRESANVLAQSDFCPIIEPVRETLKGLHKTLTEICQANGKAVVIVNPLHGDHSEDGKDITDLLTESYLDKPGVSAGILLRESMTPAEALECYEKHLAHQPMFIHAGFTEARAFAELLGEKLPETRHVFFEAQCGKLYRRHYDGCFRVLLRDGFHKRKNADHPPLEDFSDLHITYKDEGMNGFGDFLIVGDDFSEGGGPAYAVAIHLTFIEPQKDDAMYIYHFVSTTRDTPTDPAGKFGQALAKLVEKYDSGSSNLYNTSAIQELKELHAKGHFPGLGVVKKLSMKHHIETLSTFFLA